MQVTHPGATENTRSGVGAICHAVLATDRHSYNIVCKEIFEATRNGCICLIQLAGADRFELPTPAPEADGGIHLEARGSRLNPEAPGNHKIYSGILEVARPGESMPEDRVNQAVGKRER